MSEENPFEKLANVEKEIKINGQMIKIRPKTKDLAMLISSAGGKDKEVTAFKAESQINAMVNMVSRAYPQTSKESIEDFVCMNYMAMVKEVMVFYGFTTHEEMDKAIGEIGGDGGKKAQQLNEKE